MNKYLPFVIIIITFSVVVSPAYVSAITEKCYVQNIFHIFYADTAILCLDDRLTTVESSISGSADDTLCTNVGSGSQVYKDAECNFRTLLGSPDISITQQTDTITIDFNGTGGGESTQCINVGGSTLIIKNSTSGNCFVKSLVAGTSISITNSSDTITITNTSPDNTVCSNVGIGSQIYKDGECNFRTVLGSSDISVTQQNNTITIDFNGTGTNHNLLSSTHTDTITQTATRGSIIEADSNSKWNEVTIGISSKRLSSNGTNAIWSWGNMTVNTGSTDISFNINGDTLISGSASDGFLNVTIPEASTIIGKQFCIKNTNQNDQYNRHVVIDPASGDNIDNLGTNLNYLVYSGESVCLIASDSNNFRIYASHKRIEHEVGQTFLSFTKSNIGTSFVDIYTNVFDQENLMHIDCGGVTYVRIVYMWDYVGTGGHNLRWVNVADNSQVLVQDNGIIADRNPFDTGWLLKPSWCVNAYNIEWQGNSSVGTDDPIAIGYKIMVK